MIADTAVLTVSQLNRLAARCLKAELGQIWLSGEISNFSSPSSGHWYFSLKDEKAQVRCAMFRHRNNDTDFRPLNGQQVLVQGGVSLYEPRGEYQLVIERMQLAGDGILQQRFERLKAKLAIEGLFLTQYKQSLPRPPKQIGIITSPTGAALHDILQVLQRRDPALPIIIYPTMVQGESAVAQIIDAIEVANRRAECDVLLLGRGGGSKEDLWCFNEEGVARAIFASTIPIISCIGHEVDFTIADFVSDFRAPTPSAAAEIVSRNHDDLIQQIVAIEQRLMIAFDYFLMQRKQRYQHYSHRLQQQHPQLRVARQQTQLLLIKTRLQQQYKQHLQYAKQKMSNLTQRLWCQNPHISVIQAQQKVVRYYQKLQQSIKHDLQQQRQRLQLATAQLDAVSPLATMARGYSIVQNQEEMIVSRVDQVAVGEELTIKMHAGTILSSVLALHQCAKFTDDKAASRIGESKQDNTHQ